MRYPRFGEDAIIYSAGSRIFFDAFLDFMANFRGFRRMFRCSNRWILNDQPAV